MKKGYKRHIFLGVMLYVMLNCFAIGFMKVYMSSYNSVNREQLVMAQISDNENGKTVSIMGNSFTVSTKKESPSKQAFRTLVPIKIRIAEEIVRQTVKNIVQ